VVKPCVAPLTCGSTRELALTVSRQSTGSICLESTKPGAISMHPDEVTALIAALNWELVKEAANTPNL
jgi:hypothetical protein